MSDVNGAMLFGEIQAIMCEVEGMKTFNMERLSNDLSVAYDESEFVDKAEEIRSRMQEYR